MTAEEELAPLLDELRQEHDRLPCLGRMIPASQAEFRRLPDEMVDHLTSSRDFTPPDQACSPIWWRLEGEDGHSEELIVVRPAADGDLWAIAERS